MKSWINSASRAGGGSGSGSSSSSSHGHAPIPAAAKKVVQNLREIVKKHSDDEIYATLKDCDMDPNHAVHVLMNQDAFHEVKRKRVKRRENSFNNDTGEIKARDLVGVSRFDHGGTRVNYIQKHLMKDGSHRITSAQEDSLSTQGSVRSASFQLPNQTRASILKMRNRNAGASHGFSPTHATIQASGGSWTRVSRSKDFEPVRATLSAAPHWQSSIHTNASSGPEATRRQEKPAVGLDRADKKQEGPRNVGVADMSVVKSAKRYNNTMYHRNVFSVGRHSAESSSDRLGPQVGRHYQALFEEQKRTFSGSSVARPYSQNYRNTRVSNQSHQHALNFQKALEWKPKPIIVKAEESSETLQTEKTGRCSPSMALPVSIGVPTELISNLEGLNLLDDPPVFIPEHLRVPEAECTGLNFGSFDTDFELSFSTGLNDSKCSALEDISVSPEVLPVQPLDSSMTDMPPVETSTPNHPQLLSPTTVETFTSCNDAVLSLLPAAGQTTEISKPEIATQQGRHFSFVTSAPNDQGLGLGGPQPHYPYDIAQSQPQEISRPNFVPLADPTPNYFSPVFRPGSDVETHYHFLSSHGASKFGGNVSLMNAQTLAPSQEQSQNAAMPHSTMALAQPPIPVHAYAGAQPAGVTIPPYPTNVYGYQYVPSNYAYMHAPYQASYPGNNGYLQPPIGSSFAPSGRVYPSAGGATVKFPPPQYKLGTGSTPHTMIASGYGSYQTAPSAFEGINSSVTTGSATSYDDMIGPQYKDNAVYTASQQVDASALWVHSRDVSGMQANSFYNVHGPGQHAGYMPSQPAHTHHAANFASYSQSAPGPNNHQVLQQPQAGAGSHAVLFSQPQRGPVNWASNYSNLIRSQ